MDLIGWNRARFDEIRAEFARFSASLGFAQVQAIPISALDGDSVVERGDALALVPRTDAARASGNRFRPPSATAAAPFRMPVQRVARVFGANAQAGSGFENFPFRGYQGTVASGVVAIGDAVVAAPGAQRASIRRLLGASGDVQHAVAGRRDHLSSSTATSTCRAAICSPLPNMRRAACARSTPTCAGSMRRRSSPGATTCSSMAAPRCAHGSTTSGIAWTSTGSSRSRRTRLRMNDIGRVRLTLHRPLAVDDYRNNRALGSLILIDEVSNRTVAAGTIASD